MIVKKKVVIMEHDINLWVTHYPNGYFEITHSACEALNRVKEIGKIIAIKDIDSYIKIIWYPKTRLGQWAVNALTQK